MCQIWNTAKKAGKKVATLMFVGSDVNIQGVAFRFLSQTVDIVFVLDLKMCS